jgi:glycosyltransferase involved in cell wall biosynthesis
MKIVYLAAGAAGMYCGSCLHDNTLAAALARLGEDVLLVPTYTPLRTDEDSMSDSHLFFGGINVYLQQHSSIFRHTPWFLDSLLDHPGIISFLTRGGPKVEAEKLGGLTVSMLEGEHGRQRKEVRKLVRWIEREAKPDVVHLSNAMLIGVAAEIQKLGIPVVTTLSGEDIFLEKIPEPHYSQARGVLRERAARLDGFVALNRYYADYMANYLDVPRERMHVIPHGLNLAGHGERPSELRAPQTIGYFARVCPDKGLHNLIDAAERLLADSELPPFRIRAAGYLGALDRPYLEAIEKRVSGWNRPGLFEYLGEVSRAEKIATLQSFDLMCLPTVYRESKGISVLEAMANAVPVVLPDHGTFPEVVEATGGGVLYPANEPAALAAALKRLLLNPGEAAAIGRRGKAGIEAHFTAESMAQATLAMYREVLAGPGQRAKTSANSR